MRHSVWKNLLNFVLVLALTIATVSVLSVATAAKAETAPARYSQQVRESQTAAATELSAEVAEEGRSPVIGVLAFGALIVVICGGAAIALRSRKGRPVRQKTVRQARSYSPRADMGFFGRVA